MSQEKINQPEFTHFDDAGNAIMVDISEKKVTTRVAIATGEIKMSQAATQAILSGTVKKGDVLGVARVAGIMAVKNTATMIPMCHPLLISSSAIDFSVCPDNGLVEARCTVKIEGKTGVEMEALTGVTAALLTIYDMVKAIDKEMVISNVMVTEKTGGKSGVYKRDAR